MGAPGILLGKSQNDYLNFLKCAELTEYVS
jgi:hypothetical protein